MYRCHTPAVIDIPSKWRYWAPVSCVWQICVPLSSSSARFPAAVRASEPEEDLHFHVCFFSRKLHSTTAFLVSFTSLFYHGQCFSSLSLNYYHLPSSRHNLPLLCRAASPCPSSALWHPFTSRGLRPNCYCLIPGVSNVLTATQLHRSWHCVCVCVCKCTKRQSRVEEPYEPKKCNFYFFFPSAVDIMCKGWGWNQTRWCFTQRAEVNSFNTFLLQNPIPSVPYKHLVPNPCCARKRVQHNTHHNNKNNNNNNNKKKIYYFVIVYAISMN